MTEERLADLSVITMHYEEQVPVDEFCHAVFVQNRPRRLLIPTVFVDTDITAP